jgi:polyadenylate-binding protein
MQNNNNNFNTASLYVGDLHPEVTETMLFELFKSVGPVASLRVCRDAITRRSLGYAYVNFHNPVDAERALDTLNYAPIRGRPCRIMWSHRDPSLRRSGQNNVFIKNLDKSIDNKALYDTFSAFGNILSCKVSQDETGQSRGYGFVHYELTESALLAIQKVNGMLLKDKIVFVGTFQSKRERHNGPEGGPRGKFTNVYVKNLDPATKADQLKQLFERFGPISSCVIMTQPDGTSKGFGFVNFDTPEGAKAAVDDMNGQMVDANVIYVGRAQKKAEREAELRAKFEQLKLERMAKEAGVNLYVKNLDEAVDDAKLRAEFAAFGSITSAKVMRDDKTKLSKGFGFVCFSTPEEAAKAMTDMNSKMLGAKPIYVALAQRKDVRRAQLESFHRAQANLARAGFAPNSVYAMNPTAVFYPPQAGMGGPRQGPAGQPGYVGYPPQQMMPRGRWSGPQGQPGGGPVPQGQQPGGQGGMGGPRQGGAPGQGQGGYNYVMPPGQRRGGRQGGRGGQAGAQGGRPPMQGQQPGGAANGPAQAGGAQAGAQAGAFPGDPNQRGFKWTPDARNKDAQPTPAQDGNGLAGAADGGASAPSAEDRKMMLGEQLFPLIYAVQAKEAGKITGMLLESMNVQELLELLEAPVTLNQRIQEALTVLQQAAPAGSPAVPVAAPATVDA